MMFIFFLLLGLVKANHIFNFADFQNPLEWGSFYSRSCSRTGQDLFREPRLETHSDKLRSPLESLSPVPIVTEKVKESPEKTSLHIYCNEGVRNGYSVSYGFQQNKECLHGQDSKCVVSSSFGRVRAVVLNAERFKDGQDLNYIKDHFLIEEPEKFVTILNGGSIYERKFYEAVFLGGYPQREDPTRSSHTVDGKSFPLEIYLYFVDETVPSMALTTILVVLVEESDRDNPHIKPVVNAVKRLYDAERHFIEAHRGLLRRERMYHYLRDSTQYDIFDKDLFEKKGTDQHIIQKTLFSSMFHEDILTDYVETFERLEALEAELQFLQEDLQQTEVLMEEFHNEVLTQLNYANVLKPTEKTSELFICNEQLFIAQCSFLFATRFNLLKDDITERPLSNDENTQGAQTEVKGQAPWNGNLDSKIFTDSAPNGDTTAHRRLTDDFLGTGPMYARVLKNFRDKFRMRNITRGVLSEWTNKYAALKEIRQNLAEIEDFDKRIHDHFHVNETSHLFGFRDDYSKYRHGKRTAMHFLKNLDALIVKHEKYLKLKQNRDTLRQDILFISEKHSFEDVKHMNDVIGYLKQGDKNLNVKFKRDLIHEKNWKNTLPLDMKRRGYVEQGNMGMLESEVKEMKKLSPIKVPVEQAFQISWLLPDKGGYFYYDGSSPVPPCFRAHSVLVFKKPISMSKDQIKWLTRVPLSMNRRRDILNTTPKLNSLKFDVRLEAGGQKRHEEIEVAVYLQPRNQIFLGQDGVHKNALELLDEIKAAKARSGGEAQYKTSPIWIVLGIVAQFMF